MTTNDYDVLVLGGGTAGSAAASAAASAGARTALVNDGEIGGLCILRGCMPTKAMLASAHAAFEPHHASRFGVDFEGRMVPDFARIMQRKDEQVARFQRAKIASIEGGDYELLRGRGRFVEGGGVEVDGRAVSAGKVVLATGSVPSAPPFPGLEDVPYWTSDDVMRLTEQPKSLIVFGTGAIGLELAHFFSRIGTDVLVLGRSPLLHGADLDCGDELQRALNGEANLRVLTRTSIERVERDGDGIRVRYRHEGEVHEATSAGLLVATGRRPAVDGLGLEHAGLALERGRIAHDAQMRTSNPDVFVAGDVTGNELILHIASREGRVAGHTAAGGEGELEVEDRLFMSTIFTDPPFAQVGLTPVEAESDGLRVFIGAARFPETGRAITMGTEHGIWKLVVDADTREVLGSVILGPRADDLAHIVAQMIYYRGRVDDILDQPWYHPTLSEVMLNLARGAIAQLDGDAPPEQA